MEYVNRVLRLLHTSDVVAQEQLTGLGLLYSGSWCSVGNFYGCNVYVHRGRYIKFTYFIKLNPIMFIFARKCCSYIIYNCFWRWSYSNFNVWRFNVQLKFIYWNEYIYACLGNLLPGITFTFLDKVSIRCHHKFSCTM